MTATRNELASPASVIPRFLAEIPEVGDLHGRLRAAGFGLALFGGAVRDLLLGRRRVNDLDFAVLSEQPGPAAMERAAAVLLELVVSYRARHLTSPDTWVVGGLPSGLNFDIHLPEHEISWLLLRSEYTIDGLAWDLSENRLVDLVGGLEDIKARRLNIHSPQFVITDTPYFVRLFRIAAALGWELPDDVLDFVRRFGHMASIWRGSAGASIQRELLRLLSLVPCMPWMRQVVETGLLAHVIPELTPLIETPAMERNLAAVGELDEWGLRAPSSAELLAPHAHLSGVTRLGPARLALLWVGVGRSYVDFAPEAPYLRQWASHDLAAEKITRNLVRYYAHRFDESQHVFRALLGIELAVLEGERALERKRKYPGHLEADAVEESLRLAVGDPRSGGAKPR
jgi:tRNA nucleotidyltransferase/poly(A) polymerase